MGSRALATFLFVSMSSIGNTPSLSNLIYPVQMLLVGSDLVWIELGIMRNLFKSYFLSVGHPAVCFPSNMNISRLLDIAFVFQTVSVHQQIACVAHYSKSVHSVHIDDTAHFSFR